MAKLRGGKDSLLIAISETLRIVIKQDDVASLKAGILAVIHSIEAKIKDESDRETNPLVHR